MMVRVSLTLAAFLLSGSYALADGFYAGGDIRVTNIEDSDQGLSFQDRPVGLQVYAGYEFSDIFAFEGSYIDTGEAKDDVFDETVTVKLSGYVMSLVLQTSETTPNLFTKLGYYNGEQEVSGVGSSFKEDEDGLAAGLGFRHEIMNNVAIRGEVDWFETDLDNLWSVGIGVQFLFDF